jgi:hypothetical protein
LRDALLKREVIRAQLIEPRRQYGEFYVVRVGHGAVP